MSSVILPAPFVLLGNMFSLLSTICRVVLVWHLLPPFPFLSSLSVVSCGSGCLTAPRPQFHLCYVAWHRSCCTLPSDIDLVCHSTFHLSCVMSLDICCQWTQRHNLSFILSILVFSLNILYKYQVNFPWNKAAKKIPKIRTYCEINLYYCTLHKKHCYTRYHPL